MSPRKILITHSSSDLYGASKIILQVVELLIANGWQVVFVVSEHGPLVEKLKPLSVDVRIINLGVFRKKYLTPLGLVNRFFALSTAVVRLIALILSQRVTLVYSNTSVIWASGIAAKATRKKHIWHVHEIPFGNKRYIKLTGKMLRWFSSNVIAVSESVKDFWQASLKPNQIVRIYNGVTTVPNIVGTAKGLPVRDSDIIITNVSRIIPYKGHLYFFEVAAELLKLNPNLKFLIVGSSTPGYEAYVNTVTERIEELDLGSHVFMLGQREDVKNILEQSTLLYHSAIEPDPLPTVIFEAQIVGTAVAANNLGGPTEMIVPNKTGLLVDYQNPKNAASSINSLLKDEEKLSQFVKEAKLRLEREFSEAEFDRRMLSLINDTLAGGE
ncbi:glycosyltransferase family 4 protein [Roseivirga pacifica]